MATQTAGITENTLDGPSVEGRRVSVFQLRARVEKAGETPQEAAAKHTLDVAAVS